MGSSLEGIRVIDFSRMYSGPFCTMLLAELGAEVIKVEFPEGGDAVRTIAPQTEALEGYIFTIFNRGKKSITLNHKSQHGQAIARDFIGRSDILLENFSPGTMADIGLDYEQVKSLNPGLIYASISGYGHTGPKQMLPAFDTVIQAMGGLISVKGMPGSPPLKVGPAIADFAGGLFATISILAALQHRHQTSQGQFIDISMQDCVWLLTAIQFLPEFITSGKEPQKLGNRQFELAPFNIYPARNWPAVTCR